MDDGWLDERLVRGRLVIRMGWNCDEFDGTVREAAEVGVDEDEEEDEMVAVAVDGDGVGLLK